MPAVARGQGRTTDGQEAARARETASAGQAARMAEHQVVARSVMRDAESDLPDTPGEQATHGAEGAGKAGGQMSRDTPRPPHETAREYASTGSTAFVRGPDALTG